MRRGTYRAGTVTQMSSRKIFFCSSVMNEQKLGKIVSSVERKTRVVEVRA